MYSTLLDARMQSQTITADALCSLIREVFSDAHIEHLWQTKHIEQITVDQCFALLHLHAIVEDGETPIESRQLGDFKDGETAVRRLVVLLATARIERAIGGVA